MQDALIAARGWLTFAGCVLVIAVLYWGQAVIVPVALAMLLAFLLTPVVAPLQRRLGRVAAVLLVVVATFTGLGLSGWALTHQLAALVQELPAYRDNIRQKVRDVRLAGQGGSVEALQKTVEDIQFEIAKGEPRGTTVRPVVVQREQVSGLWGFPGSVAPWLEPLATAGLVVTLVIFMLLERQELRNRLIGLFGHGRLAVTTRAFDEAGTRVSRYLLMQTAVNVLYGMLVGLGLYGIGVPYVLLWSSLGAAFRFIPYVGPALAALGPILAGLAVLEGWTRPLLVAVLFGGLELFTNLVLETVFYAGAAGVSQVGLLVAVAFWTWLWGPLGLVLATPLTVCLVVVGKYVPGLEFVATLMADDVALEPDVAYYQRLLAGDHAEAAELVEQQVRAGTTDDVYDAVMLPALNYAERDRVAGRLSPEEELAVVHATCELLDDPAVAAADAPSMERMPVLGYPANGEADALALRMLGQLCAELPIALEIVSGGMLSSDVVQIVKERGYGVVCIGDLPPSAPSKSRHLVKRLRAALPDLHIVVGRWAPPALADESTDALTDAGAQYVHARLVETRDQLARLVPLLHPVARTA